MNDEMDDSVDENHPESPGITDYTDHSNPIVIDDEPESEEEYPLPFPTVAIGASAGGVEAYIELFNSLAPDTGMAFVVIPHLLADHKSHLVEILSRHTHMPVSEIVTGSRPEGNHVYILPPNTRVRLEQGIFRLENRADGVPRPIDYFFRSLAADQKTHAVGVVLSGTDSDGALGLKAIKGEGGIAMVQSPESARYSEMPRSSISVDHVDRILPPGQIAAELAQLGHLFHEPVVRTLEQGVPEPAEEPHLARILNMLRAVSGIDFRLYKPSTIRRRIGRRMLLHRMLTLAEYAGFLQGNPKELRDLQEDALINVTRFFRDPQVFDTLKTTVFPRLLADRQPDQQVRIWVAGCSSGEEAYSIGMCLLEYLTGKPFDPPIQIFGTDASEQNIQKARTGIFPESVAGEVSPERLRRFFVKVDKGFQVSKRVRDLCIFARQNLSNDPPFSKMDLISCRNVLIYFGAELQKQILPTFHYALRPNGFLLLGTSETIRDFTDLFQLVDRRHKFFARVGQNSPRVLMSVAPRLFADAGQSGQMLIPENWGDIELQRAADRIVLARYGPPGVIVDEKLDILQSRGHTAGFVEIPQGNVSLQLTRLLRDSIAARVTQAVRHAVEHDVPVRVDGLRVQEKDGEQDVSLEVLPIHTLAPRNRCFLVLFAPARIRPVEPPASIPSETVPEPGQGNTAVERLRQDLTSTKLYLQALLEERDAKNQELVSANEEIQSANEEMQSTNEELETTKEELQSSNEELQTVNDELQQRNTVLTQTSNDLSNLLNSVHLPVLMLGPDLHIRHFTPPTQRLMNLRPADIGRPFTDIRLNLNIENLEPLFNEVLETLAPREIEVQDREGHWYLLRVRPYRTTENKIEGVVVVLLDVDQLRRVQQDLRAARDFSQSVIENVPLPLAVVGSDLRIRSVNDAFRTLAGTGEEVLKDRSFPDLAAAAWGLEAPLRTHLEEVRADPNARKNFEFEHRVHGANSQFLSITGRALKPDGEMFFLITIEDITSQKEVERLLRLERERLAREVVSTTQQLGRTQEDLRALAGSLFTSQEDERRRVARELHDDISQKLAVLEIDAQQIQLQVARDPAQTSGDLEKLRAQITALSESVRRIYHALHPSVIDDLGVGAALRSLIEDFREREHMIATFTSQDLPENIPPRIATALYRIAQEALRNVSKHAGRTHVKVNLRGTPGGIRLQVIDSGEGFEVKARQSSTGLGLISMEERARMLEGSLTVESQPGEGTRVTVDVPLSPAVL